MTTKHTPGPWTVALGVSPVDTVWDAEGEHKIASFISAPSRDWQEQDANARLIAAAPDLLAALAEIAKGSATLQRAQIHSIARAASAKAKESAS